MGVGLYSSLLLCFSSAVSCKFVCPPPPFYYNFFFGGVHPPLLLLFLLLLSRVRLYSPLPSQGLMYVCVCARARTRALVLAYARERPRKTEGVPSSIRPWALGDMGEEALKVPVMIQQHHTLFVRFSRFDHCTRLHGLACVVFSRVPICTKAASVLPHVPFSHKTGRVHLSQNWV